MRKARNLIRTRQVTVQPHGRVTAWANHRRRRVTKKWSGALVLEPGDLRGDPEEVVQDVRGLRDVSVVMTERASCRLACLLRRSGHVVWWFTRAQVDAMLVAGTWTGW